MRFASSSTRTSSSTPSTTSSSSLRSREIDPALTMLLALSDLLRDVLRERAQLIPLRDEVRMVERYLEIERARFGDRLQAEVTLRTPGARRPGAESVAAAAARERDAPRRVRR